MGATGSTEQQQQQQGPAPLHSEVTRLADGKGIPLNKQSIVLPESARAGVHGPVHRSHLASEKLMETLWPEVTTIYEAFQRGNRLFASRPCLGSRVIKEDKTPGPYAWETFAQVFESVNAFGSGLVTVLGHKAGDHLGIYAINRREWVVAEHACYSQSMVSVALYDTLGLDAVAFVIGHAELSTIVCTKDKIQKLIEISEQCPTLKTIVQMEKQGDKQLIEAAEAKGIKIVSFNEIADKGAFSPIPPNPPKPEDLATIMYTSGTTGMPKGVLLTHRNVVATVAGAISQGINVYPDDVHISYLPMAHIFERAIQVAFFGNGASIGFYQGEVLKLFDDIQTLQPTVFVSVPRLFNRLYDKVNQGMNERGAFAKFLFEMGYNSKKQSLDEGVDPSSMLWDSVLFSKIKEKLGRVRLIVSGSAPISKNVFQFLQICFCCPVLQGYGLTETGAGGTITLLHDFTSDHVGPPLSCTEIKLVDVPEMNYTSEDKPNPRGEVCLRGPNVFSGYYKDDEKTKEAIDEDGWFHTGDIGMWRPSGVLSIIDRKKNIFKLSQGEYVAAEYVESVYQKNQFVGQIFVYGDSYQSVLVGILVPDKDVLLSWARAKNHPKANDLNALCSDPAVVKEVLADITATGKEQKLKGFEFVKAIHLEPEPFAIEKNLMTPTFKLRRNDLKIYYQDVIDKLYSSLPQSAN
eukprot:TRINITY_DN3916_c0_g1_i1.p1 TRINITY_DN3916_c0_g1~~TRINITY_DN3916_c0_g1_i1.p1  ORF type:complete len:689 (-),score=164.93 TRINITY_DN3916_c0_g1_i1:125-2191(-)